MLGAGAAFAAAAGASSGLQLAAGLIALVGALAVMVITWREHALPNAFIKTYLKIAVAAPTKLMPWARDLDVVVGRTDFCDALAGAALRTWRGLRVRRLQVLVGRPGSGKTAVLAHLAGRLGERGVVAVPVSLSETEPGPKLDLVAQARRQFLDLASMTFGEGEAESVWRKLALRDRLVILVDEIEEPDDAPLFGSGLLNPFWRAVTEASRHGVPLVVATHPTRALRDVRATTVDLPPLEESAAADYVMRGHELARDERARVERIAAVSEACEAPFYLRLARDLHDAGDLDRVDVRSADRVELRVRLLDAWLSALVTGHLQPDSPVRPAHREHAVRGLSLLACMTLRDRTREVALDGLDVASADPQSPEGQLASVDAAAEVVAIAIGLGLLEPTPRGGRFTRPVLQAYLGARAFQFVIRSPGYLEAALEHPGADFLLALVMYSRMGPREKARPLPGRPGIATRCFKAAASQKMWDPRTRLATVSAAIEIFPAEALEHEPLVELTGPWDMLPRDDAGVTDAKLDLIARLGDAARGGRAGAYRSLYELACRERLRKVCWAAGHEIGIGGDAALAELRPMWDEETTPRAEAMEDLGDERLEREVILQGWILPMLLAFTDRLQDAATDRLREWMAATRELFCAEVAVSQGFKRAAAEYARRQAPRAHTARLQARAEEAIGGARSWYARLTLVQALGLLHMYDPSWRESGPDPAAEHPLVAEAAHLVARALETRQASRFIWADEHAAASQVVPLAGRSTSISDASPPRPGGWRDLDAPAQLLLADVILLLNLTEGLGGTGDRREEALRRASAGLPECLSGHRHRLWPDRLVGEAARFEPGIGCAVRCGARLCPHPPKDASDWVIELDEAFCRRQQSLCRPLRSGGWAAWLDARRFWRAMEERARR
ncbi:MAG: ATP-binding protein [Actinomycetota bacterium]|nr:ATP-binding protein [Actinomycetota bacterium]